MKIKSCPVCNGTYTIYDVWGLADSSTDRQLCYKHQTDVAELLAKAAGLRNRR